MYKLYTKEWAYVGYRTTLHAAVTFAAKHKLRVRIV